MLTCRELPARFFVRCHCNTDCSAAFRNSSGPLTTCASATLPFASSFTSTTTVPCTPCLSAAAG